MTDPTTVNESFGKLRAIEAELGALFVEREDVVRAMLILLANSPMPAPPLVDDI
jgi:hypothetical protein